MSGLTISNKIIEKYFGYLIHLDDQSKENLIKKLTSSLKTKSQKNSDFKNIYGSWEDNRNSDEIIDDLKNARVVKVDTIDFQ